MSNEIDIRNLIFHKNEYKNCFLISCIKYTWKFILNNNSHTIYLFYIKLFGKRQIFIDNKKIFDKRKFTCNFQISFPVEFYNITICQKENCFILKINDISFNKLLNDLKLKKFNILEDNYKMKQEEEKKRRLQKRKHKILLNTIKNFGKKKDSYEINLNNENKEEDNSQTIYQSFEINEKDLDTLNKFNNNKINGKYNNNHKDDNDKSERKNKFKPKEKNKYNIYKNMENSYNDMIDYELLGNDSIISGNIGSTNIYRNNSTKQNKDSTKTESK